MKCPRCVQNIHRAAAVCPHCGFSISDADASFGADEVRMRRLTDHAGILRRGEREPLEAAMLQITRRCPQVFVAVYTGALGETTNLRQFGFWLLNRAVFEDVPAELSNDAGILIVIDPETKCAGITFGYLLDAYLTEADTFDCLSRGHAYWLEERYTEGLVRTLAQLEAIFCKRSRQARRDPAHFQRKHLRPVRQAAADPRRSDEFRQPSAQGQAMEVGP